MDGIGVRKGGLQLRMDKRVWFVCLVAVDGRLGFVGVLRFGWRRWGIGSGGMGGGDAYRSVYADSMSMVVLY